MISEDQLEQLCLNWFQTIGYSYVNGYDLAPDGDHPERVDYRQVVLFERLLSQLQKINPHIPLEVLERVSQQIAKPESPVLIKSNHVFHRLLLEGVKVDFKIDGEEKTDYVALLDFATLSNNQFLVVNQYTLAGSKGHRRPDVVVFVNGLPLAVLELKNPADPNADIWAAYQQLQTYKDEISDLFIFNEVLVVSDGLHARVGSLTANKERFLPWRTLANEDDKPLFEYRLETLVKGFFQPELFLDYLHYFILFEQDDGQLIKKIAGYHQFHAVREAVIATVIAAQQLGDRSAEPRADYAQRVMPGSGKAGVVWHTQGSGKSISMVCYASKLLAQPEMNNPTIVVVTDRNDLDGQLFNTFSMAVETLKQTPVQAGDRDDLREMLAARQAGGIIFTTIQKFALLADETSHPVLSNRHNIVVISDEAHRSQYGDKAKLNAKGQYTFGYSKHLRDALPSASFIGFTGTPIAAQDKDTRAVFGDYVSIYDIQDAVDDGATVPIYYESRLAKLDINTADIEALNAEVDEVIEDEEDIASRENTKSKWAALEKLVGSAPRVEQVAKDLVSHFATRVASMPGKAMIVCMSRDICVELYNAIVALKPEWQDADPNKGAIKIVMTGSASDHAQLQPHIYSKTTKKLFEKRFKDAGDPLQLVIVRDMWLTGFDAPCCHTMYIDKPMKGHNLMQAIARVNRVFKDKPGGLVVDYIGIASELKQALKTYTDSKGKGAPTLDTHEAYALLLEKLDIVQGMMQGFDYSAFASQALQLLPGAMNHILSLQGRNGELDGKKRFLDVMTALSSAYTLCSTLDEVEPLKKEIAFFSAVKAAISKFTTVDKRRSDEEKNSALKQIIDNAIVADGVDDIFSLVGLDKPNIGLLSPEFMDDVAKLKEKNLAVDLLERLLRDEVKARMKTDVVSEKKYSERILESLRKYHNRAIETAQVIEELIAIAKDMQVDLAQAEKLGLNPDEIAFYRALIQNESAVRELGDNNLRELAKYITEQLRNSTTVDWAKRDSVRARLRNLVRRALRRWKYPPDKADEAVELCLKQAEVLSEAWSAG
ncbi:type I restriction endonuclease subunit R [Methylomonas rosea]|uniref:Type I restriction enzyme endonuclease subunit n=1 Tax=Methylomonas rosea TaxID=2952227 RepID=A0ABT1TQ26_9GAMM|nr:type I restriction endonuclease subunit R [Methylomonas sp. WSC-7]MCQ8116871.1 type I restriction endonuclease subunit R [Methylomonas sp. WSC-7]